MTEAERLDIIQRAQDYLRSSQQLQTKADALIQQASRPPFSKQQALEAFRHRQERAVLSSYHLYLTNSRHHDLPTTLYSTYPSATCSQTHYRAQPFPVIDQEAIAKSGENLAANLTKAYQHGRILHFTEAIDESYTAIVTLQQQVLVGYETG